MDTNEQDSTEVNEPVPVEEEIAKAEIEAVERANDLSKGRRSKKRKRCDDSPVIQNSKNSKQKDCCQDKKDEAMAKARKSVTVMVFEKDCVLPKTEIIPRQSLTKDKHLDMLATPKHRCPSPCSQKAVKRILKPVTSRTKTLAQPPLRCLMTTLENAALKLPPHLLDNLIKTVERESSLTPEQAARAYKEKKHGKTKKKRTKKSHKLEKLPIFKTLEGIVPIRKTTFDKDAVMWQYEATQQFVKSILDWQCPIPREEFSDIAEVILERMAQILDYSPFESENRKSQQMRFLADVIACWISGVLVDVAERHKKELEEECEKRRKEMEEEDDEDDQIEEEEDEDFSSEDEDEEEDDEEDEEEEDDEDDAQKKEGKDKAKDKDGDKKDKSKGKGDRRDSKMSKDSKKEETLPTEGKEDERSSTSQGGVKPGEEGVGDSEENGGKKSDETSGEETTADKKDKRDSGEDGVNRSDETSGKQRTADKKDGRDSGEGGVKKSNETSGEQRTADKKGKRDSGEDGVKRSDETNGEQRTADKKDKQDSEEDGVKKSDEPSGKEKTAETAGKMKEEQEEGPLTEKGQTEGKKTVTPQDGAATNEELEAKEKMRINAGQGGESKKDLESTVKKENQDQTSLTSDQMKKGKQDDGREDSSLTMEGKIEGLGEGESLKTTGTVGGTEATLLSRDQIKKEKQDDGREDSSTMDKVRRGTKEKISKLMGDVGKTDPKSLTRDQLREQNKGGDKGSDQLGVPQLSKSRGTVKQIDATSWTHDLPFVTFDKTMNTLYKMLENMNENLGQDPLTDRLHMAIYNKFERAIVDDDPQSLTHNLQDVVDVTSGKIAVWLKTLLRESEIDFMTKNPGEVESKEVRNWSQRIMDINQTAYDWNMWLQRFIREAQNMTSANVTKLEWQNWTKSFHQSAFLWRRHHLETQHELHHKVTKMLNRNVVKTGQRKTNFDSEELINTTNF